MDELQAVHTDEWHDFGQRNVSWCFSIMPFILTLQSGLKNSSLFLAPQWVRTGRREKLTLINLPGSCLCIHWTFVIETSCLQAHQLFLQDSILDSSPTSYILWISIHSQLSPDLCRQPENPSLPLQSSWRMLVPATRSRQQVASQPHCPRRLWQSLGCLGQPPPSPSSIVQTVSWEEEVAKGEKPAHRAPFLPPFEMIMKGEIATVWTESEPTRNNAAPFFPSQPQILCLPILGPRPACRVKFPCGEGVCGETPILSLLMGPACRSSEPVWAPQGLSDTCPVTWLFILGGETEGPKVTFAEVNNSWLNFVRSPFGVGPGGEPG